MIFISMIYYILYILLVAFSFQIYGLRSSHVDIEICLIFFTYFIIFILLYISTSYLSSPWLLSVFKILQWCCNKHYCVSLCTCVRIFLGYIFGSGIFWLIRYAHWILQNIIKGFHHILNNFLQFSGHENFHSKFLPAVDRSKYLIFTNMMSTKEMPSCNNFTSTCTCLYT